MTAEMQVVELMKYLGIGYSDLMDAPAWVRDISLIRMREDAEYKRYTERQH